MSDQRDHPEPIPRIKKGNRVVLRYPHKFADLRVFQGVVTLLSPGDWAQVAWNNPGKTSTWLSFADLVIVDAVDQS